MTAYWGMVSDPVRNAASILSLNACRARFKDRSCGNEMREGMVLWRARRPAAMHGTVSRAGCGTSERCGSDEVAAAIRKGEATPAGALRFALVCSSFNNGHAATILALPKCASSGRGRIRLPAQSRTASLE